MIGNFRINNENWQLSKFKKVLWLILQYSFLTILAITILYPIMWMIGASFKEKSVLFRTLTQIIPSKFYFGNYTEVLTKTQFLRSYFNSIVISLCSVVGLLLITSMAAYSFARLEWRGKELMFRIILFGQLVSPISIIIPTFIIVDTLKLTSTYPGLIFLYLSRVAFGVFILRTFFESIPREIEEAGIIDGCSPYQMYFRIMLPLARPSLAAVGVFYFFFVWNDFLYPFVIMHKQKLETIPVAIYNLQGRYGIAWDLQTAALSMAIVPAVIATVLFHRLIVRGLTAGAIK